MTVKSGWQEAGRISLISGGTIEQYDQVVISGNGIVTASGSGGAAIGVAMTQATATGLSIDVLPYNAAGTAPAVTAASVTAGAPVYTFTSGLVKASTTAASGTACRIGVCVVGSTSTGDQIAFVPGLSPATT